MWALVYDWRGACAAKQNLRSSASSVFTIAYMSFIILLIYRTVGFDEHCKVDAAWLLAFSRYIAVGEAALSACRTELERRRKDSLILVVLGAG